MAADAARGTHCRRGLDPQHACFVLLLPSSDLAAGILLGLMAMWLIINQQVSLFDSQ
jgi:hypothetical protein